MLEKILPFILSGFTGERQKVDIVWSSESWTHNLFRIYELVFWRKAGIRREATTICENDNGKIRTSHYFHTFEASIAHVEGLIRSAFKGLFPYRIQILVPAFNAPRLSPLGSPYLFAIAFDAETNGSGSTTTSFSHTVSGSNTFLVVMSGGQSNAAPNPLGAASFNSVSMTKDQSFDDGNFRSGAIYHLIAPASGAHTVATAFSPGGGSPSLTSVAVSYTGALQSGQPDSSSNGNQAANPFSAATTVVLANCWLACLAEVPSGSIGVNSGGTSRSSFGQFIAADSNGTVGTGSQAILFNSSASNGYWAMISFAPIAPTAVGLTVNMMNSASRLTSLAIAYSPSNPTAPAITVRTPSSPWSVVSFLTYVKTSLLGTILPVLDGNNSDKIRLRIYNNWGGIQDVVAAINVSLTTWDGASHTASMAVASQQWLRVRQSGFGVGSSGPALYTSIANGVQSVPLETLAIGGANNDYVFNYASDGTPGFSEVRTGFFDNLTEFLEFDSFIKPNFGVIGQANPFVLSIRYEYIL